MEKKTIFEALNAINVNDKTEKKDNLTYLSWVWAWAEVKKLYPLATYEIVKNQNGLPYFADESGAMVYTTVTINDLTHEMWLPVMDGKNKAMKTTSYTYKVKEYVYGKFTGNYVDKEVEPYTMFDVNKTIMRCLVKNLAMFGLGLYIYAGEDLPEGYEPPKPKLEEARFVKALENIKNGSYTVEKLRKNFELSEEQQAELDKFINEKTKENEK